MNKVIVQGNLVDNPVVRYTQANAKVVSFAIAINDYRKEGTQTTFISCTAFNKAAEFISKYFRKGKAILVEGRLYQDRYLNKYGQNVSQIKIVVDNAEFYGNKSDETIQEKEKFEQETMQNAKPINEAPDENFGKNISNPFENNGQLSELIQGNKDTINVTNEPSNYHEEDGTFINDDEGLPF